MQLFGSGRPSVPIPEDQNRRTAMQGGIAQMREGSDSPLTLRGRGTARLIPPWGRECKTRWRTDRDRSVILSTEDGDGGQTDLITGRLIPPVILAFIAHWQTEQCSWGPAENGVRTSGWEVRISRRRGSTPPRPGRRRMDGRTN